jgi:hypothetical protein
MTGTPLHHLNDEHHRRSLRASTLMFFCIPLVLGLIFPQLSIAVSLIIPEVVGARAPMPSEEITHQSLSGVPCVRAESRRGAICRKVPAHLVPPLSLAQATARTSAYPPRAFDGHRISHDQLAPVLC